MLTPRSPIPGTAACGVPHSIIRPKVLRTLKASNRKDFGSDFTATRTWWKISSPVARRNGCDQMPISKPRKNGFALPAVLAVTGVVTLIFLVAITALASLNAETRAARDRVRFLQSALTVEATATFMAVTEPFDSQGIHPGRTRILDPDLAVVEQSGADVRLDGHRYLINVGEPLLIRLQDEAGLINLARLDSAGFTRLFAMLGVGANEARIQYARYRDYADVDDLRQANGAETREYGANAIANRPLLRPGELLSVLGTRDAINFDLWRAMRSEVVSDVTSPTYNVNTMTPRALQVIFGLSARQAETALQVRETRTLRNLPELGDVVGMALQDDGEILFAFPSGRIVYEIRDERSAWVYTGRISLTPTGDERPFWIDQTELLEASRRTTSDTTDATELPYAPRGEAAR